MADIHSYDVPYSYDNGYIFLRTDSRFPPEKKGAVSVRKANLELRERVQQHIEAMSFFCVRPNVNNIFLYHHNVIIA